MTTDDQDPIDPTARDVDGDLSIWTEGADAPVYEPVEGSDHPLSEPLHLVADVAERLQTWASDLAHALRRRGGRPTTEEVDAGRELALRVQEAVTVVAYLGRHMP